MTRAAPTVRAIGRYFLLGLVTLVFLSVVIYVATLVVPADPAKIYLGKTASPEQVQAFREQQGLDQGVVLGYVTEDANPDTGIIAVIAGGGNTFQDQGKYEADFVLGRAGENANTLFLGGST